MSTILKPKFNLRHKQFIKHSKEFAAGQRLSLEEFFRYDAIYHSLMDSIERGLTDQARFFAACLAGYVRKANE
jgi:hypothetical protein